MSHKIKLSELERALFPEYYPFYNQHFQDDLNYLKKEVEFDETAFANIHFKIRVIKFSQKVRKEELRDTLYHLFNKHVEYFYDWHQSYNWYELKSILVFFLIFSDVKTFKDLEKEVKKNHNQNLLKKYVLKDQTDQIGLPTLRFDGRRN